MRRRCAAYLAGTLLLLSTGCVIPIPHYSVSRTPMGVLSIVDAQTGKAIDEALFLVVKNRYDYVIESTGTPDRNLSDALFFRTGDEVVVNRDMGVTWLVFVHDSDTEAFLVIAPGYEPLFFRPGLDRKPANGIVCALSPIPAEQSAEIMRNVRSLLESGQQIEPQMSMMWEDEAEGVKPGMRIDMRLNRHEKRLALESLTGFLEILE